MKRVYEMDGDEYSKSEDVAEVIVGSMSRDAKDKLLRELIAESIDTMDVNDCYVFDGSTVRRR